MNSKKTGKPRPEEICSRAHGSILEPTFTNGEAGPFSKKYLSGKSICEYLEENEDAHYLLINKSDGLTICPSSTTDASESITAGPIYRSIMAVTDRPIIFALGGDEEDSDTSSNSGDIEEVNRVTDVIGESLNESGFCTRGDLKKASLEDIAEVDGVNEQVAIRIKLDVGG